MGEPVEERRRQLGIGEDLRPFREGEVGRDDDRGPLLETADQVEQQLASRLREREVAKFIKDEEIDSRQSIGNAPGTAELRFRLELVDEIDVRRHRLRHRVSAVQANECRFKNLHERLQF